ncbi:MAG TPA: hypothetical protein VJM33_11120 [Microthrixaceae bacterium]|nr:hypothetical protein [Microthrixaceae bacterium]
MSDDADQPAAFDVQQGFELLADIQRRGLEAANQMLGTRRDPSSPPPGDEADPAMGRELPWGSLGLPSGMFDGVIDSMNSIVAALVGRTSATTGTTDTHDVVSSRGELVLEPAVVGGSISGELWIENDLREDVADVELHCGELRDEHGAVIPASAVRFEPANLRELPGRSARGIEVTVEVPEIAIVGTYVGVVRATNLPDFWATLSVIVTG